MSIHIRSWILFDPSSPSCWFFCYFTCESFWKITPGSIGSACLNKYVSLNNKWLVPLIKLWVHLFLLQYFCISRETRSSYWELTVWGRPTVFAQLWLTLSLLLKVNGASLQVLLSSHHYPAPSFLGASSSYRWWSKRMFSNQPSACFPLSISELSTLNSLRWKYF